MYSAETEEISPLVLVNLAFCQSMGSPLANKYCFRSFNKFVGTTNFFFLFRPGPFLFFFLKSISPPHMAFRAWVLESTWAKGAEKYCSAFFFFGLGPSLVLKKEI